jgi:uncharacterized protein with PQ loop repeat
MNAIGYVGAVLLALSAIPQVVTTVRQGHARGLSWGLLALWLAGEASMLAWAIVEDPSPILLANFGGNLALVSVLAAYRLRA